MGWCPIESSNLPAVGQLGHTETPCCIHSPSMRSHGTALQGRGVSCGCPRPDRPTRRLENAVAMRMTKGRPRVVHDSWLLVMSKGVGNERGRCPTIHPGRFTLRLMVPLCLNSELAPPFLASLLAAAVALPLPLLVELTERLCPRLGGHDGPVAP